MIGKHIVVIGGLTQGLARPTGTNSLWHKLRIHQSMTCEVWIQSWHNDFAGVAQEIWRSRPQNRGGHFNDHGPDVRIIGYSFGGYSATTLARHLAARGIYVREMVLCDPVYRHWYKLGWWRSLVPWSCIEIPWNVNHVSWLKQENPRFAHHSGSRLNPWNWVHPAGHDLKRESKGTVIEKPVVLRRDHQWMDDAEEFHRMALEAAA